MSRFLTIDEDGIVRWSASFALALLQGDWAGTFQFGWPGVTTLWGGTVGLLADYALRRSASHSLMGFLQSVADAQFLPLRLFPAVRLTVALTTAAGVVAIYWLVSRLFGRRAAVLSAALIALDPLFLANSRVIHTDALLALFATLSVLCLAIYLRQPSSLRYLIVSGLAAGLAALSKSPALFLAPFTALALGVAGLRRGQETLWPRAIAVAGRLALWAVVAAVVFFALWPATWADPLGTVGRMMHTSLSKASPDKGIVFFWGRMPARPDFRYYPVAFLFKSTPPVLIGLAMAVYGLIRRRDNERAGSTLIILAYALLFVAFISPTAKTGPRYMLPAVPALNIVAAAGLDGLGRWGQQAAARKRRWRGASWPVAVSAVAVLWQAALILPQYPYYFTYYNPLAGGPWLAPRVLQIGWGEGLDRAASYLNAQPNGAALRVASWYQGAFAPFFDGATVDWAFDERALGADYVVCYANQFQRDQPSPELARYFRGRLPEHVVRLKGMDHAWLYRGPVFAFGSSPSPAHPLHADFGDEVTLLGYGVGEPEVASGGQLHVTLYWQAKAQPAGDYSVFVRLRDEGGRLWAHHDGWPVGGLLPTSRWRPGMIVADEHTVPVTPGTPPGPYRLDFGLYSAGSGQVFGTARNQGPVAVARAASYPPSAALPTGHRIQAELSPEVELLGYDFDGGTFASGQQVGLALWWRATRHAPSDYLVSLRIEAEDGAASREQRERPVDGRYPSPNWQAGEVVWDQHSLTIAPSLPSGRYRVAVALVNASTGQSGREVALGELSVKSRPRTFDAPPIQHPLAANFDDKVALLGYDLEAGGWKLEVGSWKLETDNWQLITDNWQPGIGIHLTLYWRALAEMDTSYTVFTHLLDGQGQVRGQHDGVPGDGALPTTGWAAGEVIADVHDIAMGPDAPPGEYQLEVGMYDASTGQRLPAVGGGDHVLLGTVTVSDSGEATK